MVDSLLDADQNYPWGPGDMLPENTYDHNQLQPRNVSQHSGFRNLIQQMENKIDSAFSDFNFKLQKIESRMTTMENNPIPSSSPCGSSSDSSCDGKRKRRTPLELQV